MAMLTDKVLVQFGPNSIVLHVNKVIKIKIDLIIIIKNIIYIPYLIVQLLSAKMTFLYFFTKLIGSIFIVSFQYCYQKIKFLVLTTPLDCSMSK